MPNSIDFDLYLISDRTQVAANHTLYSTIEAALQGGVRAIQLREKDLSVDELRPLAEQLRQLTRQHNAKLLINRHLDLALEVDADGVHLGGDAPPADVARQQLGPTALIGVSTHSLTEIAQAAQQGADFVTFGPVYATPSKLPYGPPQGLAALTTACHNASLPVFALGGINNDRKQEVLNAGATGIALISAICASPNPAEAARKFLA